MQKFVHPSEQTLSDVFDRDKLFSVFTDVPSYSGNSDVFFNMAFGRRVCPDREYLAVTVRYHTLINSNQRDTVSFQHPFRGAQTFESLEMIAEMHRERFVCFFFAFRHSRRVQTYIWIFGMNSSTVRYTERNLTL